MSKPIEGCPQPETEIRDRAYTDRQLLELAAKAAGLRIDKSPYNVAALRRSGIAGALVMTMATQEVA